MVSNICHINFLWKKGGLKSKDLPFLDVITFNSFDSNSDGEGLLTPTSIIKRSQARVIPSKHASQIINQQFIIYHERLGTHGQKNADNTQPIKIDDIVFIHNGIMYGNFDKQKSDSYLVCEKITKELGNEDRTELPKILKRVFESEHGSKSVFVYDQKTNKLFYYKNSATSFYFVQSQDVLFCSTSKENVEYARLYYDIAKKKIVETQDDTLFEVKYDMEVCGFEKLFKIQHAIGYTSQKWGKIGRWIEEDERQRGYHTGGYNGGYCGETGVQQFNSLDDDYKIVTDANFGDDESEEVEVEKETELDQKVFVVENFLKAEGITDFVINVHSNRLTMTCKEDTIFDHIAIRHRDITTKLDNCWRSVTRRFYVFDLDEFIQTMGLMI